MTAPAICMCNGRKGSMRLADRTAGPKANLSPATAGLSSASWQNIPYMCLFTIATFLQQAQNSAQPFCTNAHAPLLVIWTKRVLPLVQGLPCFEASDLRELLNRGARRQKLIHNRNGET